MRYAVETSCHRMVKIVTVWSNCHMEIDHRLEKLSNVTTSPFGETTCCRYITHHVEYPPYGNRFDQSTIWHYITVWNNHHMAVHQTNFYSYITILTSPHMATSFVLR